MPPHIKINVEQVKDAGGLVQQKADEANTQMSSLYESGLTAKDGNAGFATGNALVSFATNKREKTTTAITLLRDTGQKIVESAQLIHATDQGSADGLSRTASGLDDLGH
ncbi:hypothetical protein Srot_2748 [Segniliparus rotundus DSM 44985]|uniref:WXG100 family type VII secretion target n=1 Tax=Segniliparus rotundus (strain ATCC BAA-972 / CDC 1076 / CIP 108378 / DSM 44985 / JCM 13578) TaxID=640132 RepID=D6ZCZ5_SEGRD|nr:hypothetical protein [Segniliparus rotundus]ADG99182.1 hypothetical protein Srot_2748 [Segniliparus rotundus DSM 44985]